MKHGSSLKTSECAAGKNPAFRLETILVPTDFSEHARFAFRYATRLAEKVGGTVVLLNVVENPRLQRFYEPGDEKRLAGEAQHKLGQCCQSDAIDPGDVKTLVRMAVDSVWKEIISIACDIGADLIILSSHEAARLKRFLLGNTIRKIVRHAPCAVLLTEDLEPDSPIAPCERILLANDLSPSSTTLFEQALTLAKKTGAKLLIAHVADATSVKELSFMPEECYERWSKKFQESARNQLQPLVEQARQAGVETEVLTFTDIADEAILKAAREQKVSLIVIGLHRLGTVARFFMKSTAAYVVKRAACPILIVPVSNNP